MFDFGIYILTYPGDFHLSTALIRSIRYFHPGIPMRIIPGEGFDRENHPFDIEILPEPGGFWATMGYQSRDFWAFQGPFDKFLYLDADVICTGSLDSLFKRIQAQEGQFLFVHICFEDQPTWEAAIRDENNPLHESARAWVARALGRPDLQIQFDPDYDPYSRAPFNTGIFASKRGTISEADLKALYEKEAAFYETKLKTPFTWKACTLFYSDQGRLNYLVDKLHLSLIDTSPDGNDSWAGDIRESVTVEKCLNNKLDFKFIHWAGVPRPRPSICCHPVLQWLDPIIYPFHDYRNYENFPEIPGYALWRYFQSTNQYPMRINDWLRFTCDDLRRLRRGLKSRAKALLLG
jgi:hypothetical protein